MKNNETIMWCSGPWLSQAPMFSLSQQHCQIWAGPILIVLSVTGQGTAVYWCGVWRLDPQWPDMTDMVQWPQPGHNSPTPDPAAIMHFSFSLFRSSLIRTHLVRSSSLFIQQDELAREVVAGLLTWADITKHSILQYLVISYFIFSIWIFVWTSGHI